MGDVTAGHRARAARKRNEATEGERELSMKFDIERFRGKLKDQMPQMLQLLETLVNIDSGSYCKKGVDRVSSMLADELTGLGFDIQKHALRERGDQVIATKRLKGKGRLLILGHADTVWPEGTAKEWPFALADGRATGPGVGDMKGGLVMATFALRQLLADGFDALESIRFFIVPDEELGSVQSRARIEEVARTADWTLVLEPGRPGGGVVTARGALGAFRMCAHGHSAHCAVNPKKGASAIRELSLKVPALEALSDPDQGRIVNVGIFRGGAARQVVPHEAEIDIDLRARTQTEADQLVETIKSIAAQRDNDRVSVEVLGQLTRPAFMPDRNRALFDMAKSAAAQLRVDILEVGPTPGGSDGNFAAALGVPTLDGLGPVCWDICSRQETIDVGSLADRGAMFASIIHGLGARGGS